MVFLMAVMECFGGEYIRNADFKEISSQGLPLFWQIRTQNPKGISVEKEDSGNVLKLNVSDKSAEKKIQLFQYITPTEKFAGREFILQWEARGTANKYGVIGEWTCKGPDGLIFFDSPMPAGKIENSEFKKFKSVFKVPKDAQSFLLAVYLYEPGILEIRNLNITPVLTPEQEAKDQMENFPNFDCQRFSADGYPLYWKCYGDEIKGLSFPKTENGSAGIRMTAGKGQTITMVYLLNHKLEKIRNKRFILSYDVKATPGTLYGFYYEGQMGAQYLGMEKPFSTASEEFTRKTVTFDVPQNTTTFYFAIVQKTEGTVELKNISLKEVPLEKTCGGVWRMKDRAVYKNRNLLIPGGSSAVLSGVKVEKGQKYRFAYRVSASGSTGTQSIYHRYNVSIKSPGRSIQIPTKDVSGNQKHSIEFIAPGKNIDFHYRTEEDAEVTFSDFELTEIKSTPADKVQLAISSPAYRSTFFHSMPEKEIRGSVRLDKTGKTEAAVVLRDADNKVLYERFVNTAESGFSFSIPAEALSDGKYTLPCRRSSPPHRSLPCPGLSFRLCGRLCLRPCRHFLAWQG